MYILQLNHMRDANIEILMPVARAETKEALKAFLEREKVEKYVEEAPHGDIYSGIQWEKCFRKGGPLEWYNPPFDQDEHFHFIAVGSRIDWVNKATMDAESRYDEQIMPLAEV